MGDVKPRSGKSMRNSQRRHGTATFPYRMSALRGAVSCSQTGKMHAQTFYPNSGRDVQPPFTSKAQRQPLCSPCPAARLRAHLHTQPWQLRGVQGARACSGRGLGVHSGWQGTHSWGWECQVPGDGTLGMDGAEQRGPVRRRLPPPSVGPGQCQLYGLQRAAPPALFRSLTSVRRINERTQLLWHPLALWSLVAL